MNALQTSKIMHCPSCYRQHGANPMRFTINAGAWCCVGCGWVKEFTKAEAKKFTAAAKDLTPRSAKEPT